MPPCKLPPWPSTWAMNASTIIMPCNYTGYQVPETVSGWGIVDFDWSNSLAKWSSSTPMDNDERQLKQVEMIKRDSSTADYTKVWIYRNSVYGYPWFTSVRKILDDPLYEPWFLKFDNATKPWTSPACDDNYDPPKCTQYFHTQMDTPLPSATYGPEGRPIGGYGKCYPKDGKSGCNCGSKPCGFYVFNHSSTAIIKGQSFLDWFLDGYMLNEIGSSELIDGFYWDDTWYDGGVGDDPYPNMTRDMGLTKGDILQLASSYEENMRVLINRTLAAGKFAWQLLGSANVRATPPAACTADLLAYCRADALIQHEAAFYQAGSAFEQDLANFLLIRGEYAYFGHGWQGCAQPPASEGGGYIFPDQLRRDYGHPIGLCVETAPGSGVFTREFTKSTVQMDCNSGTSSIEFK